MKTRILCILLCLFALSCKKEFEPLLSKSGNNTTETNEKLNSTLSSCIPTYAIHYGNGTMSPDLFPDYLISLTYDDGPDTYSNVLAQFLTRNKISATFFVVKNWNDGISGYDNKPILQTYRNYGHRIGNHTESHIGLCGEDPSTINTQINNCQIGINPYIGNNLFLFRAPYYSWPDNIPSVINMNNRNFDAICSNIDVQDYNGTPYNSVAAQAKASDLCNLVNNYKHGIILLHDRIEFSPGLHSTYAYDMARYFIPVLKSQGYVFVSPILKFSEESNLTNDFSDNSDGAIWGSDVGYYGTIRLADVTGDGKADLIARKSDGIYIARSNGQGFEPKELWKGDDFTDALGWKPEKYSITFQYADVDGDGLTDLIARGYSGIIVALNIGNGFGSIQYWSFNNNGILDFSDLDVFQNNQNWGSDIGYYGTFRVKDVTGDGKADIIARGLDGIYVAISNGHGFNHKTLWKGDDFTDALGWKSERFSTTIQIGDVDNDGKADLVARGYNGMVVCKNTGTSFGAMINWSTNSNGNYDFSDADGWGNDNEKYYRTIRLADINGDGVLDVCGRGMWGIVVAFSSPNLYKFLAKTIWTPDNFFDIQGWNNPQYNFTIQFGDINLDRRADLVARYSNGIIGGYAP